VGQIEQQTCPRRMYDFGPWKREENLDHWERRKDGADVRKCSFCGSMHPDDFMAAAKAGAELGPTHKSSKVHVHDLPSTAPGRLRIVGSGNHPGAGLTAYKELSKEHRRAVRAEYRRGKRFPDDYRQGYFLLAPTRPTTEGKFYFQHLSEEQQHEFIDLLNAKALTIGYPGRFYRLPFFIQVGSKSS